MVKNEKQQKANDVRAKRARGIEVDTGPAPLPVGIPADLDDAAESRAGGKKRNAAANKSAAPAPPAAKRQRGEAAVTGPNNKPRLPIASWRVASSF